jgi:two-component system, cell cycle sensor histidine kinase and response regulator CckA
MDQKGCGFMTGDASKSPLIFEDETIHKTCFTVLLVDDGRVLTCLFHMLRVFGYKVIPVSTPQAALDIAADRQQQIDLLMTEMMIPEMNGLELSRQITAIRPGMKTLYSSGHSADNLECLDMGVNGMNFIKKPYKISELQNMLASLLT